MKYKIFTFAFALLSCTSNLPDNESTVFEELDTSRPLTTSVKSTGETEDVLVGETPNSTLSSTIVKEHNYNNLKPYGCRTKIPRNTFKSKLNRIC